MISWKENPGNPLENLLRQSANLNTFDFLDAVHRENMNLLGHFMNGTNAYRFHPYTRNVPEPHTCTSFGSSVLYRYTKKINPKHRPVFVIPSLVNKSHILDLMNDFSFMRFLASRNLTPYMLDWGNVGETEKTYGFDEYYKERLIPALDFIAKEHDKPVDVIGYCMGGTMAIGLACLKPAETASLTLVAAPWDFHADNENNASMACEAFKAMEPGVNMLGCIPPDALQFFFTAVDPLFALKKYSNFAKISQTGNEAERFVAVEDWLNDGVPLVAKVARTAFVDWYGNNTAVHGEWELCGMKIKPEKLKIPFHVISASRDRLVPPASSITLPKNTHRYSHTSVFDTGHIGLMAGSRAENEIWPAVADWICAAQNRRTAQ